MEMRCLGMGKRTRSLEAIRVLMMVIIVISHFGFLRSYSYGGGVQQVSSECNIRS